MAASDSNLKRIQNDKVFFSGKLDIHQLDMILENNKKYNIFPFI